MNAILFVVLLIAVAAGIKFLLAQSGSSIGSRDLSWRTDWEHAAHELGLKAHVRKSNNDSSSMRGDVDGHRVSVTTKGGRNPEIEVRFESGLRWMDIDRRREGSVRRSDDREQPTGNVTFDEYYRVRSVEGRGDGVVEWLNPARQEILVVLADALSVDEIEENEIEVRLGRDEWTASELVQAVQLCVLAAQVLDQSHKSNALGQTPQDRIVPDAAYPQDRVVPPTETD